MTLRTFACPSRVGTLAGLRSGDPHGPKVLAVHGWLDNAASFVPLSAQLPQLDLVMLDLPGHGHSEPLPAGADYLLTGALHPLLDAADALGWERFAVIGHSMGAAIASTLAAAAPQRIEKLVAIEMLGGLAETVEGTLERLRDSVAATRRANASASPLRVFPDLAAPVRARMLANQLSEPAARLLVERGVEAVEGGYVWRSDRRLTLPTAVRLSEAQVQALLAGIDCPARVIYADPAQPYFPEPLRNERAARLRHGRVHVLPGTHHLHMEQPAAVAALLHDFF
ncbi:MULTISPECIES: alpha/beta hydrolase [unclassified Xanthomonas]|uniref:alpha/beta fold hydrolase n=1 Tax=unclassified Xanthomonas TaxID=2643310 RepID=UPI001639BE26|nr:MULTISPECIES: alpha/beta hydrolase [unclassified Xanthomonas]QNH14847.1 alpha/beta hydrolase [Xanthomonas sp. SI]QNH19073.1 alpha/beta hydrolase [Xanthomonas sp. SS]